MQYPQIQFYRGSLVRLASGKLKQVEDLSSEDFLESGRLIQHPHNSRPCNNGNTSKSNTLHSDENNNSVFNSPEPTPSYDSPTLELMDTDMDYEQNPHNMNANQHEDGEDDDEDEELDVVSDNPVPYKKKQFARQQQRQSPQDQDLYIDSSVVKDFLEVGPPSTAHSPESSNSNSSPHPWQADLLNQQHLLPSTSDGSPRQLSSSSSSLLNFQQRFQPLSPTPNATVLIKFFLESSRSIVFIEVPTEHPFFVFHRGWSSWNPQRTYDKFGLKCRKLKIGDTCISLIRRQRRIPQANPQQQQQQQQQDSDHCNILFSSIKIN